jgi:fucose permease
MNFFTDILSYPFRGAGKTILLIGALISVAADLASLAPGIGGLAALILSGYFCSMYFQIIESSAIGGLEAPEYPNLMNLMEDMVWPAC